MQRIMIVIILMSSFLGFQTTHAQSSSADEAKWLLERLTGTRFPVDSPIIAEMAGHIANNYRDRAVQVAMSQPQFLNITVKQLALQMSTREETIRTPFNDFAASFIGVTRDDLDARQLLTGNFYYAGDETKIPMAVRRDIRADFLNSNNHYADLESQRLNLGDVLVKRDIQQIVANDVVSPNPDPAGVLTSRAFLDAHATAGTNRRLVEFAFRQFMCSSIDQIADTLAPDIRIGRDIDRYPGGDPLKFQTSCKGCHTVMDGFRGAFAKWDFRNNLAVYSATGVAGKMNANNTVYPGGFTTVNDSWVNHATRGNNATSLGWRGTVQSGNGVRSFAELLANSQRFSQCMAKRVFDSVCKRTLSADEQQLLFIKLGNQWEASGYKMKKLFEIVSTDSNCRFNSTGAL